MGECGVRGGYAEIVNMDPGVMAMLQKSISAKLCPPVLGQVGIQIERQNRQSFVYKICFHLGDSPINSTSNFPPDLILYVNLNFVAMQFFKTWLLKHYAIP
jgi:hypothetical protein